MKAYRSKITLIGHLAAPHRAVRQADTATACGMQLIRLTPSSRYYRSLNDGGPHPATVKALTQKCLVTCQKCKRSAKSA